MVSPVHSGFVHARVHARGTSRPRCKPPARSLFAVKMAKRGATDDDGGLRGALDKKRARSMTPGLGDIMGGGGYAAAGEADEFTPLQRVVLSANGNLQRLMPCCSFSSADLG